MEKDNFVAENEKYNAYALKILKADREKLMVSLPFFARALYALQPCFDVHGDGSGIGTDGEKYFGDSRQMVDNFLSPDVDTAFAYLHSVLHCVYLHVFFAASHENDLIWDLAADISIFDICRSIGMANDAAATVEWQKLCDDKVPLNAQGLYRYFRKKLSDGSLDEADIQRLRAIFKVDDHDFWRTKQNPADNEAKPPTADNDTSAAPQNAAAPTELITKWSDIADHAEVGLQIEMEAKKTRGEEAGHLLETLNNIKRDELDYTKFLRKFAVLEEKLRIDMDAFDYNYYTYGLELYHDMPLIEPLEYKEEYSIRDFVIAIDTSGSCDLELIRKFLEKTYGILTETAVFDRKINVHIIQCDADIQEDKEIHNEKELHEYIQNLEVKGRGGTDFRPVFARIADIRAQGGLSHIRGLIYFTDGYGIFPQKPPDYKTAFAFAEADEKVTVPPWAMQVYIEEEGLA